MKTRAIVIMLALLIPVVGFGQTFYSQDFENLAQTDGQLSGDGWLVYGNIFDPVGNYLWGHGPWAAPNNQTPGNWCDIVTGQGGPAQDAQCIVLYSDFANGEHASGNLVESNLFVEQALPAGCSGTWTFTFDGKKGDLTGASTASAFIKILNPAAGWSSTMYTVDMTNAADTWTDYSISVDVTGLDGQILQFGFMSVSTNYEPCGVYYDNVVFSPDGTVATDEMSWDGVKSLYR